MSNEKVYEYRGYHPTVELAKKLGWEEDPDWDEKYTDAEGHLDTQMALDEAFEYIRSKGWTIVCD